jgi:MraZ protein
MNPQPRFFTDEVEHTLDSVNRIVIPAAWRTDEGELFYVFKSENERLVVLPASEMEKMIQSIENAPNASEKDKRDQIGGLSDSAVSVWCDKQGRITMDVRLIKHANLKDKVILVGRGRRFEIWNPKLRQQHKGQPERQAARSAMMDKFIN